MREKGKLNNEYTQNVKFPDMEHYDIGKVSDRALYLARCDFYSFRR